MSTDTPIATKLETEEIPELVAGDRLSRAEFERRYHAMSHVNKAELIEGVVYMPSPVSRKGHGSPQFDMITWLGMYKLSTPGVEGCDNATVRLDLDNEPQPDAFLRILPEHGGQSVSSDDDYVEGPPELVAEISSSSASYDLHDKLNAYRRNGVCEYIVWRVRDKAIDWFVLQDGKYEHLSPGEDGIVKSKILPGLWLDPAALVADNLKSVVEVMQQGLATPEHAAFVKQLNTKK